MRRLILEEPYSRAAIWSRRLALAAIALSLAAVGLARVDRFDSGLSLAALWRLPLADLAARGTAALDPAAAVRTGEFVD